MHLSVIIPAYNEAKRITKTLISIRDYLSNKDYDWEVLVVSDGSKDNTVELVNKFISENKGFRLIDNKKNNGKGYVVKQGILEAKGAFRLFTDADNSTTIDHLEKFWPYTLRQAQDEQNYDIVIGSIEIEGAEIFEHAQWYRRWLGRISKYLIRFMTGLWHIHDTQRGFKLFNAKAARDVFSRVKINRFGFDFEALALAKKLGYKIKEVPIVWSNPGESKVSLKSYIATFRELIKVRWYLWTNY
ncbi:MAG: glycosyl transferase family protein [Parcubacteria group bacterium Gr01-1014_2]|nr:MAG: glycosyl transferase family protein [Parcubacteria group bacterium Gr01-1014_2]